MYFVGEGFERVSRIHINKHQCCVESSIERARVRITCHLRNPGGWLTGGSGTPENSHRNKTKMSKIPYSANNGSSPRVALSSFFRSSYAVSLAFQFLDGKNVNKSKNRY